MSGYFIVNVATMLSFFWREQGGEDTCKTLRGPLSGKFIRGSFSAVWTNDERCHFSGVHRTQEVHQFSVSCSLIFYPCISILLPFIFSPPPLLFLYSLFIMQRTKELLGNICIPPPLFFISITLCLSLHHAPCYQRRQKWLSLMSVNEREQQALL